jgi:hypothetical protein
VTADNTLMRKSATYTFIPGMDYVGRSFEERTPLFIQDVREIALTSFLRQQLAAFHGITSIAFVPFANGVLEYGARNAWKRAPTFDMSGVIQNEAEEAPDEAGTEVANAGDESADDEGDDEVSAPRTTVKKPTEADTEAVAAKPPLKQSPRIAKVEPEEQAGESSGVVGQIKRQGTLAELENSRFRTCGQGNTPHHIDQVAPAKEQGLCQQAWQRRKYDPEHHLRCRARIVGMG